MSLNRWRSFPLAYFFDDAGFSEDLLDSYRGAITTGLHRWSDATGTELGTVVEVANREQANFAITFRHVPSSGTIAQAFHSTGTPFLAVGEIAFNSSELKGIEERVRDGEIDRDVFFDVIAGVTAHEMGHILGIIGHPNRDDVLMGTAYHEAPVIAEVNTLIHAYCGDS